MDFPQIRVGHGRGLDVPQDSQLVELFALGCLETCLSRWALIRCLGVPISRRAIESYLLLLPLCCSGAARHVSLYSHEPNFCPGRGWYPMHSHPLFVQGEIAGLILA